MSVIWKYELGLGQTNVYVPLATRLLKVDVQEDRLMSWVLREDDDLDKETVQRVFYVIATGVEFHIPEQFVYVDSFQMSFVGHVFSDWPLSPRKRL